MSPEGYELLKHIGVDLAINASTAADVSIRNVIFELAKTSPLQEKDLNFSQIQEPYLQNLRAKKAQGARLYYRPSIRDPSNTLYESFLDAADFYSYEQRFAVDNFEIMNYLCSPRLKPTPYYRQSIFLAIWWAVASGCSEIYLFGITLAHVSPKNPVLKNHPTLRLVKGENAFTLIYKLWLDLRTMGVELKIDNGCSLSGVLPPIFGDDIRMDND
ncbi:hypothetical protein N8575_02055 [Gammaproteobacteria bacterium]|nr:hypothetical protein [Gammaproteobacteria bacterium]